jgi:hypothetical protein
LKYDEKTKKCLKYDCPAGKFFDESETCLGECDAACQSCIGPRPDDCLSCATGFEEMHKDAMRKTSYCGCPEGTSRFGVNKDVCSNCHYSCHHCSGPNEH